MISIKTSGDGANEYENCRDNNSPGRYGRQSFFFIAGPGSFVSPSSSSSGAQELVLIAD
jgi:hypothetical protein